MSDEIKRKEFFGIIGKGAVVAAAITLLPLKIFSSVSNAQKRKNRKAGGENIKITINPSAVKRNGKVK